MKNDFDNKLTDRGWRAMRQVLDREMPEQRRRRFVWWLFALLLLPLVGTGGWWLHKQSKPTIKTLPPVVAPKISEPVVEADRANRPKKVEAQMQEATIRQVSDPKFPKVGVRSSNSPILDAQANTTDQSSFPNLVQGNLSTIEQPEKQEQPTSVSASSSTPSQAKSTTEMSLENGSAVVIDLDFNIKKIEPLPLLPARHSAVATVTTQEGGSFTNTAVVKKKRSDTRWSFGLAAGLASEKFSALNGLSAGAAVNWQFHKKWGLRSGLQYARYRLSQSERPVVLLDAQKYADATGNFSVVNQDNDPNSTPSVTEPPSVLVPVERLHLLEMPLLAYWQPVRSLRVFGGISNSYRLSVKASQQSYSNNQSYYANSEAARDNLNELTSSSLPRWKTYLQTGLGLRLGKHLEIDAFYRIGFPSAASDNKFITDPSQNGGALDADWKPYETATSHYFLLNGILFF